MRSRGGLSSTQAAAHPRCASIITSSIPRHRTPRMVAARPNFSRCWILTSGSRPVIGSSAQFECRRLVQRDSWCLRRGSDRQDEVTTRHCHPASRCQGRFRGARGANTARVCRAGEPDRTGPPGIATGPGSASGLATAGPAAISSGGRRRRRPISPCANPPNLHAPQRPRGCRARGGVSGQACAGSSALDGAGARSWPACSGEGATRRIRATGAGSHQL